MKDGFQNQCSVCQNSYWKGKTQVSKEDAEEFLREKTLSGELFQCKNCKRDMLADKFYYQRAYGTVKIFISKCRECQTNYQREKALGVTEEDFNILLKQQENKCAICKKDHDTYRSNTQNNRRFAVDHDHKTGKIRGLLCDKCNRGIGYFKDSEQLLLNAIKYLKG